MSEELTVQSLNDAIHDKVRKVLLDSLPDHVIDGVIKNEFHVFFEKKDNDWTHGKREMTIFEKRIRHEVDKQLTKMAEEKVKEWASGKNFETDKVEDGIKDFCKTVAPAMMESFFTVLAEGAISRLKGELQNQNNYGNY